MKQLHKNLLIYFITIFMLIEFLINSSKLINVFFNTLDLCIHNLFPSIFIFFTITDILNNYHFPYYISKLLGKLTQKIYKIPAISSYIIIMSLSSGFPSNAKLIKEQLDNDSIDVYDATKILTMTHFSNPLFIIYTVGISFFHDKNIGLIILLVHYFTNFIIGFLFRNIFKFEKKKTNYQLTKPLSLINLLKSSFYNSIKIIINVFGIIIFLSMITSILNNYLNLSSFSNVIFNGLIEITTGLKYLSVLNIEKTKAIALACFFISFGGFSIHMQTMTILNKYDVNYYIYLVARLIHGSLSSLIIYIILIQYYK